MRDYYFVPSDDYNKLNKNLLYSSDGPLTVNKEGTGVPQLSHDYLRHWQERKLVLTLKPFEKLKIICKIVN